MSFEIIEVGVRLYNLSGAQRRISCSRSSTEMSISSSVMASSWARVSSAICWARSSVKGWHLTPSHYLDQDLAEVWLDK